MKKVTLPDEATLTVPINNISTSNYIYVYVTGAGNLYVLSKLGYKTQGTPYVYGSYHYGFVNVSKTPDHPKYADVTATDSIISAIKDGNNILEFPNFTEVMKWKLKINE